MYSDILCSSFTAEPSHSDNFRSFVRHQRKFQEANAASQQQIETSSSIIMCWYQLCVGIKKFILVSIRILTNHFLHAANMKLGFVERKRYARKRVCLSVPAENTCRVASSSHEPLPESSAHTNSISDATRLCSSDDTSASPCNRLPENYYQRTTLEKKLKHSQHEETKSCDQRVTNHECM